MTTKIIFNSDRCKGCGLCIGVCPLKLIKMTKNVNKDGWTIVEVDLDKCIGCGMCSMVCPDLALTKPKK